MLGRVSAVLLIGLTRVAVAADASGDFPAFPMDQNASTAPAPSVLSYGVDTPIQTLAANPAAVAIVDSNIPGLLEDSNYPFFKGMSLKTVTSLSHGKISSDILQTIAAQLKSVPISTASNGAFTAPRSIIVVGWIATAIMGAAALRMLVPG